MRMRRPKARIDQKIISICEIAAREEALTLAKQSMCSQGAAIVSTENRCFILDSGASFNLIGRQHLSRKEIARIRRPGSTIQLTAAAEDVESSETVDIYGDDLEMTFRFWFLPKVPPILSIRYLVKRHGFGSSWEMNDDNKTMWLKLPQGGIVDSLLVNDVLRNYVDEQCNLKQANDAVSNPDGGDKNPLDGEDADVEVDSKQTPVPKRTRKGRGRTAVTPVVKDPQPVHHAAASSATPPDSLREKKKSVPPPLVESSSSDGDFRKGSWRQGFSQ